MTFVLFAPNTSLFAQFGIRAGINLASEVKLEQVAEVIGGLQKENLTGYQIGLIYQAMPAMSGLGADFALMLSQKGYVFTDKESLTSMVIHGYKEVNYFELPVNLRYRVKLGFLAIYGYGGMYAGYLISGKSTNETQNTSENISLSGFKSALDYGYNLGMGFEFFNKIQLGASWSQGLKEISSEFSNSNSNSNSNDCYNRVFSVNLCYMF